MTTHGCRGFIKDGVLYINLTSHWDVAFLAKLAGNSVTCDGLHLVCHISMTYYRL